MVGITESNRTEIRYPLSSWRHSPSMQNDHPTFTIVGNPNNCFSVDSDGLLVWVSTSYGTLQQVVSASPCPYFLLLYHYSHLAGHGGKHPVYDTMKKGVYWLGMVNAGYETACDCSSCAQNLFLEIGNGNWTSPSPKEPFKNYVWTYGTSHKHSTTQPICGLHDGPL